jgi:hypothetical protein
MNRLLVLGLLLLVACSPFFAEVDAPSVCVAVANQAFPGALASGTVIQEVTGNLQDGGLFLSDKDTTRSLRVTSVKVSSTDGTDLHGITRCKVEIKAPPSSGLQDVTIVDETQTLPSPTQEIPLKADPGVELEKFLYAPPPTSGSPNPAATQITARVTASGTPPPTSWTGTVETCFHVTVSRSFP